MCDSEDELAQQRHERMYNERTDQRKPTQRDRDRVLYASAFSRLGGVTQVISSEEGHPFHNRLTHSLKVAQIARRIAERLKEKQKTPSCISGVDPDACEAAALAHDLGHPPFGHIAEHCLDQLLTKKNTDGDPLDSNGFEGNAQSFRIVARLAQRRRKFDGLNLTRSTLDAILKYPWLRSQTGDVKKSKKFGAYDSDVEAFVWAREPHLGGKNPEYPCANAAIMDWADDLAYAVHDVEDFYRVGIVPLDRLCSDLEERRRFLDWVHKRWTTHEERDGLRAPISLDDWEVAEDALDVIFDHLPLRRLTEPYAGGIIQRKRLRRATAFLIGRYLNAVLLEEGPNGWELGFDPDRFNPEIDVRHEVELLKQLIWFYVIDKPELRSQQYGQQKVIGDLFRIYTDAAAKDDLAVLPVSMREAIESDIPPARAAADAIASLTERQALVLWRKLTGIAQGSMIDHPVS